MNAAALCESTGIKRATLFRDLETLLLQGLILHEGEIYRISAAGQSHRSETKSLHKFDLDQSWPWLSLMPTKLHAATAKIALFCFAARYHNLTDDRHPAIVLLGPTMRLKSWLAKSLCWLAGSTPDRCCLAAGQVRSRGLLARLNAAGEIQYENQQLKEPFLWLEELSLAESAVSRDFLALIHGTRTVQIESHALDVKAVPLAELNECEQSEDLEQRLGLRPERIRRTFISDFKNTEVPRSARTQAGKRMNDIKAIGPVVLGNPPQLGMNAEYIDKLESFVEIVVKPAARDYVDPGRILTAFHGACCFLPPREALLETMSSWSEMAASTGFVIPRWREQFAFLRQQLFADSTVDLGQVTTVSVPEKLQKEQDAPMNLEAEMNRFKQEDIVIEIHRLMHESQWRLPEERAQLSVLLSALRKASRNTDLISIVSTGNYDLEQMFKLTMELVLRGIGTEKLNALINLCDRMQGNDCVALDRFAQDAEAFIQMGVSVKDAAHFIKTAIDLSKQPDQSCNTAELLDAVSQRRSLRIQIEDLTRTRDELTAENANLRMSTNASQT